MCVPERKQMITANMHYYQVNNLLNHFLVDYSHFVQIRLIYSNRAVIYSNTAVRKHVLYENSHFSNITLILI